MISKELDFTAYSHIDLFERDDNEIIEIFHEHTKLSAKSTREIGRRVGEIKSDPNILAMMNRSWKTYPAAPLVPLDKEVDLGAMSLQQALQQRSSVSTYAARFARQTVSLAQLSALLRYSYGAIRPQPWRAKFADGGFGRPVASSGGLFPMEIYPIVLNVDGVEPGLYHYNVPEHGLHCLRKGNLMEELQRCTTYHDLLENASVLFVMTGVWKRTLSKYRQRGYRFLMHDAGTLLQNLYLTGTALELGTCALGGLFDDRMAGVLDVNPVEEPVLLGFLIGGRPEMPALAARPTVRPA